MEGQEGVRHIRSKFEGHRHEVSEKSDRSVHQPAASLAKQQRDALQTGFKNNQSPKLAEPKRTDLTNAPLSQSKIQGLGQRLPDHHFCEKPALVPKSKNGKVVESAGLKTGMKAGPQNQRAARSNVDLPQKTLNLHKWPPIQYPKNEGVSSGTLQAPTTGTAVPAPVDTPQSVTEKDLAKVPRKKPLPQARPLQSKPVKPSRPPVVDLEKFRKARAHASPIPKPQRDVRHGYSKPDPASFGPVLPKAAPFPHVSSLAREQDEIYDDVEPVGPVNKGKQLLLFPNSQPTASFHSGQGGRTGLIPGRFPPDFATLRKSHISKQRRENVKNLKDHKKEEKADREFQKKFKFEGEIRVLTRMMIDPATTEKKGGGKNLPVKRGEIVDVIQFTSSEQMLCRNSRWKYGYIPRAVLLHLDADIYDDVGICDEVMNVAVKTGK
ncbi:PREDICTED: PML-RARA-regulated adapter molecule 1 isoform X1 [Crocodylus porosus]|uniref:PML-RARA-regulated adapter molecule 1 isoform X1 n=1 Tax=Crocodylus porosus TaxID=8502 RepID=UPI00093E15B1|nr:PREDICTED: PML-RARA-regulated adapter molecule 1 isoform X1 [Crocodylus porosus]